MYQLVRGLANHSPSGQPGPAHAPSCRQNISTYAPMTCTAREYIQVSVIPVLYHFLL